MGNVTGIKIIVEERFVLDYESPKSLGINFNRIVEDLTDLSKRFGEFSYTFSLPITKNNSLAFEFAGTKSVRGIFVGTKKTCRVYNNNKLILDGIIELRALKKNTYSCAFFSSFTQLIDDITGKKLNEILSLQELIEFKYEPDIVAHLNNNFLSSDETFYQFPLINYSTPWTPYSVLNGASADFNGAQFLTPDVPYQNWYYIFGSDNATTTNQWYFHQFPMAIYIKNILESMLEDVGWSLGGSFFEREEIKKIIMLFTGDNDIYDQAIGCPENDISLDRCSGVTSPTQDDLWTATFLPDMSQTDFLKGLINMFNLYFTIDVDNKIIKFETWKTLFSDTYDPYDITTKIFSNTINLSRIDNYDPSISFSVNDNMAVLGDNKVMISNDEVTTSLTLGETSEDYTQQVFNRIGTTSEISIPFGLPQVSRQYLRQDLDVAGSNKSGGDFQIFIPSLTVQNRNDNNSLPFYKETSDTFVQNTEDKIKHKGQATLMYYYGQSNSDLEKISGTDNDRFYYIGIGSAPTRVKFGISSPFALVQGTSLNLINNYLGDSPVAKSKDTAEASYLKGLHYMLGISGATQNGLPEYSLTFGEDDTFGKTLWTEFHKDKYDLYFNSELLEATMRMNDVDWLEMSPNRPIKYNDELYLIIALENYDVVNGTCNIKLIKK